MVKRIYTGLIIIALLVVSSSCSYEFPEEDLQLTFGNLHFENFVVIGDSYTAGYMDGALYDDGQSNSVPAIISRQVVLIQPFAFVQPDIESENGYNALESVGEQVKGRYVYQYLSQEASDPSIIALDGEIPEAYVSGGPLNNWSVPGIRSFEMIKPGFSGNTWYDRLSGLTGPNSLVEAATTSDITFFILFTGMQDVLGYAIAGGIGNHNPDPEDIDAEDLTPFETFEEALLFITERLLNTPNTKGILCNIPDVTEFAYFNTIPWDPCSFFLSDYVYDDYDFMYDFYKEFNNGVENHNLHSPVELQRPLITFLPGATSTNEPLVIRDESLPDAFYPDGSPIPKIRVLTSDEKILLNFPVDQIDPQGFGYTDPVPDEFILTSDEIDIIGSRILQFNDAIQQLVTDNTGSLVLVDLYSVFYDLKLSTIKDEFGQPEYPEKLIIEEGVPLIFDLGIDGIFSLDGINPNQKGSAYIANRIIDAINEQFIANIPKVNINHFRGNTVENQF